MRQVTFVSIFPELLERFCEVSLLGKAQQSGLLSFSVVNPRDFSEPPHFKVDDTPYGGGAGMVMIAQPLLAAIRAAKSSSPNARVVLLSPSGPRFDQRAAHRYANHDLIFVCGRYEGIDQRVIDTAIDEECSLGDFILMGGEVAALCIVEATARLIPGVLGNADSSVEESFDETAMLEAPSYTKPAQLPEGIVPDVLLSGDHQRIASWRKEQRILRTNQRRPDLLKNRGADGET